MLMRRVTTWSEAILMTSEGKSTEGVSKCKLPNMLK